MAEEAVAIAREIDIARQYLKDKVAELEGVSRTFLRAEARYRIERTRITDGLGKGTKYLLDEGKPGEQEVGGKVAASNIKGMAEGIIAKWYYKMGIAKIDVDVCKTMIHAAETDLDALRSKNKYLSHT